jgi:hypothetical protein
VVPRLPCPLGVDTNSTVGGRENRLMEYPKGWRRQHPGYAGRRQMAEIFVRDNPRTANPEEQKIRYSMVKGILGGLSVTTRWKKVCG